jgi:hypothetical protein
VREVGSEDLSDDVAVGLQSARATGERAVHVNAASSSDVLTMRTTRRYLGVLYLFLSCVIRRWRA